ncbi:MAG: hypothetical protein IJM30_00825 [Thermoguttaceae bacterium]|nr:hypothetical protein [Thermoguttaceae bacterium]
MKKKDKKRSLLGREHAWTDTQGRAHRVVFDEALLEKPKTMWVALGLTALAALVAGTFGVLTVPTSNEAPETYAQKSDEILYGFKSTIHRVSSSANRAFAAGWNNEFFVADASGVALYNVEGERLNFWESADGELPTAATFVSDKDAATNGLLLVAYGDRIKSLRFSLDNVVPGEGNDVIFTAKNGARGELELVLTIPGADVRGLACSSERLFVADYGQGRVWRYSWKKLEGLVDSENKTLPADCVIGDPDSSLAYPGLKPVFKDKFAIAYLPLENELFVANSGTSRIDAFNGSSGAFRSDRSWTRSDLPGEYRSGENPIALAVSAEKWVATADFDVPASRSDSSESPIRIYDFTGAALGSLPYASIEREEESFVVDLAVSPDSKYIMALDSNGDVDVWERLN